LKDELNERVAQAREAQQMRDDYHAMENRVAELEEKCGSLLNEVYEQKQLSREWEAFAAQCMAGISKARVQRDRLRGALIEARQTLAVAIGAGLDGIDMDVSDHVTIKAIDAALQEAADE